MTLVSICIPTYNGAEFLDACLDSARAQTHRDLEILVVDDCSSDDTLAVADRHARQDPRITVSRNPRNLGLVGNWNRCIELARGDWIKFLFQDDLLHPQCVEKLLAEGLAQGRLLVACDREFLFDDSIGQDLRSVYARNRLQVNTFLAPARGASAAAYARNIVQRLRSNFVGEPTVTLIHRRAFENFGPFHPDLAQICDVEYWARVAGQAGIAYVPEALATFRAHAGGTSALNRNSKMFRAGPLDGLLLTCRMLDEPVYAELRRHWAEAGLLEQVRRKRFDLANEARAGAAAIGREPLGSHTVAQEYAEFLARHPQCRVGQFTHVVWRIRAAAHLARKRLIRAMLNSPLNESP